MMTDKYLIKDKYNRIWGEFGVKGERFGSIYGYLTPYEDYEQVRKIFLDHENAFNDPLIDNDPTINDILKLGAFLVEKNTGNKIQIKGNIFIDKNLLVTCAIPDNEY